MSDEARLAQLFATDDLTEIVWSDDLAHYEEGKAASVDVVLSSPKPTILASTYKVGLAYWPNGPVVRGVQNYALGSAVTFRNVPVKPGSQLIIAADRAGFASLPARVDIVANGQGAGVEGDRRGQSGGDALGQLLAGIGGVLGAVIVIGLIYIVVKES